MRLFFLNWITFNFKYFILIMESTNISDSSSLESMIFEKVSIREKIILAIVDTLVEICEINISDSKVKSN